MAIVKMKNDSTYGVVELNRIASVKTGETKAQYALNSTDFASIPAENGMLLVVNEFDGTIDLPANANSYCYLHASVEKDYEEKGRKYFAVNLNEFLPRMYKLHVGDVFEASQFQWDDGTYANWAAVLAAIDASTVYGVPAAEGYINLVAAAAGTETVVLKAKSAVTLPNGETGLQFVVTIA